jgi:hypothetical protein
MFVPVVDLDQFRRRNLVAVLRAQDFADRRLKTLIPLDQRAITVKSQPDRTLGVVK